MGKICTFTGHRDIPVEQYSNVINKLTDLLVYLVENEGYTDFRAGGAIGFDTIAALTVLELKKKYDIKLHLILPCRDQDRYFTENQRTFYRFSIEYADSVTYTSERYSNRAMSIRNRALVNGADLCVAYLTRLTGGTYRTVTLARREIGNVVTLTDSGFLNKDEADFRRDIPRLLARR